MFSDFLNRLTGAPAPLPESDARLALAALLVRCARADGEYSEAERNRIGHILAMRYGLSPFEAIALRGEAETLETEAPDTVRFTRVIKDAIPHDERLQIVEALWQVALADGTHTADEDALVRLVVRLLGIGDVDSALARQRAANAGLAREGDDSA